MLELNSADWNSKFLLPNGEMNPHTLKLNKTSKTLQLDFLSLKLLLTFYYSYMNLCDIVNMIKPSMWAE